MRAGVLLLLAAASLAAPERELSREEAYNYRIVGFLPKGWKRRGPRFAYVFSIDAVPHAYIHFVRQRVDGPLDVSAEIRKRETQYIFPGAPKDAKGDLSSVRWGGRKAVRYEFKAKVQGVNCTRRVTVLFARSVWYELIETIYGETTASIRNCRAGLELFRTGFRLLTPPLPAEAATDTGEQKIVSTEYGFTLVKPAGFTRVEVHPASDPGCRVAFQRAGPDGNRHARVRLFEFAVRRSLEPKKWLTVFYTAFAVHHQQVRRKKAPAWTIPGAREVTAERFSGMREGRPVSTLVMLVHAESGRVFVLRVRTQADAREAFADELRRIEQGFRVK